MTCPNMKIADVLFFIANLITIYSSNVHEDVVSTTLVNEEMFKRKLDKDCPQLLKIIHDNNVTDFTVNCKTLNTKAGIANEESVLGQACLVVKNILYFICDNKYNVTSDLLRINNVTVCPFNFSQDKNLNIILNEHELVVKELTQREHCNLVCNDLYSIKVQCAVLSQLNNFLKSQQPTTLQADKSLPMEHNKHTTEKNETSQVNKNLGMEQQSEKASIKNGVSKPDSKISLDKETAVSGTSKKVVKPAVEEKTEKMISTSKEEQLPKTEIKVQENENLLPDDDFKSVPDDANEDVTNEDGVASISESIPYVDKVSASLAKVREENYPSFLQPEDSHFVFYFIMVSSVIVIGYLAYHNKNKILAYALEGTSGRRSRRRPNPARYRKLETNLEEAISSSALGSTGSNVVY